MSMGDKLWAILNNFVFDAFFIVPLGIIFQIQLKSSSVKPPPIKTASGFWSLFITFIASASITFNFSKPSL